MCTEVLTHLLHLPGTAGGKGGGAALPVLPSGAGETELTEATNPTSRSESLHCQRVSEQEGDVGKGFSVKQNVDNDTIDSKQGRVRRTQREPHGGELLAATSHPPMFPLCWLRTCTPPGWRWGRIRQDHSS